MDLWDGRQPFTMVVGLHIGALEAHCLRTRLIWEMVETWKPKSQALWKVLSSMSTNYTKTTKK